MPSIVRVDADKIIYAAGFAVEKRSYHLIQDFEVITMPRATKKAAERFKAEHHPGTPDLVEACTREPVYHSKHIINTTINRIQKHYPKHSLLIYLTACDDSNNFRHALAKTQGYKANRKGMGRPIYYDALREHIMSKYAYKLCDGYEADDAVIMDYEPGDIIAGVDKDLLQFASTQYNYDKGIETIVLPEVGRRNFFHQVMFGDEVDNIPGMRHWCKPRCWGPVKTSKLIADCVLPLEYYHAILEGYKKTIINEEFNEELFNSRFEEQCQLLWLWRHKEDTWDWSKLIG